MNIVIPEMSHLKSLLSHFKKKQTSLRSKKPYLNQYANRDSFAFHIKKTLHGKNGSFDLVFDAQIRLNDFISIMGRSGAGKTSLLRMLCGLLTPDSGFIRFGSEIWYDSSEGINLPPQKRRASLVFQDYALFPNMTVFENLKFATNKGNYQLVNELLKITGLENCADNYPGALSGGQAQRVALVRAIVNRPKLLLLDEPMAALDNETRKTLQDVISSLHNRFGITSVMVTHDLSDVFRLSNKLMKIENGNIVSFDKPENVISPQASSKLSLHGIITSIDTNHISTTLTVFIDNSLTKIVIPSEQTTKFRCGDKVLVAAKAYNPVVITSDTSNFS